MALASLLLGLPASVLSQSSTGKQKKAAPNFTLADANGASITLANYKGKVVLLNFWATWCHGCGEEIPWFIDFQQKYKDKGLAVIGVSMDDDGWKSVTPFVQEKKISYTVVIGTKELSDQVGLLGMPMTLLIDRDGKIDATFQGVVDPQACENQIRALLAENGTAN